MRKIFALPIRFYSYFISPLLGPRCRFTPTCSAYAITALEKHGLTKGLYLSLRRILHCHPWSGRCGCDPVPERFAWTDAFRYTGFRKKKEEPQP